MAEEDEKAVWEDKPQVVFEKYSRGDASLEDYVKSLSICDITDYAGQAANFAQVCTELKSKLNSNSSTEGEKKAAEHYLLVLESIHDDKVAEFEQSKQNTSAPQSNQQGSQGRTSLADRVAAGRSRLNSGQTRDPFTSDYDAFSSQTAAGFDTFSQQIEAEHEAFGQQIAAEHEAFGQQIEAEHEAFGQQIATEHEAFVQEVAQQTLEFQKEMEAYQKNPYTFQDYSAQTATMGLTNSTVLQSSRGTRMRSLNGLSYTQNTQTEFRQADNGFALMNNNQIRAVTIDDNKNLHFQISENGQTRDMSQDEAAQFMQDLHTGKQGQLNVPFNDGLLSAIEAAGNTNTAANTRQAANEEFAQAMEQPWQSYTLPEAIRPDSNELDMSPENVQSMTATPTPTPPVQNDVEAKGAAPAQEAPQPENKPEVTVETPAVQLKDPADITAKMNKVAEEARQAFAGIPGVKIERGKVDISNGEFKFTPHTVEAPVTPAPTAEVKTQAAETRAPAAEVQTPAVESREAAESPDIALMANKIRYMNVVNNAEEGSAKYVDPEVTAQKLQTLYGDKAVTLLDEALMAPNDANNKAAQLGEPITQKEQTLSREAVNYLADMAPDKAKEYAALSTNGQEDAAKSKQEALQENMADLKANNPEQYGDLMSAVSQLANGGDIEQALLNLVVQMMKQAGYADSAEGQQAFVQDAQTAARQIETAERQAKLQAGVEMPTTVNIAQTKENADPTKIKAIELDQYGYLKGSKEAQKHDEDLKQYRDLYKNDPKKFKKAKEGYEKAAESGEMSGQAKYHLDVINTVEKEEKLKKQMLKDQEKAAKQIKKLEKKIEKQAAKGNDEKVDALKEELQKLKKEEPQQESAPKEVKVEQVQTQEAPAATVGHAEATPTGFAITKGNEVRTVTFENGGRSMQFMINDKPMTKAEANQFMQELKEAENLDQNKVALAAMQKDINEKSGTQNYAPERKAAQNDAPMMDMVRLNAMMNSGNSMG